MEIESQRKNLYDVQAAKALGGELRERREKQGITLEDISSRLKLSVEQIQNLEKGDYAGFSGVVFAAGFLRSYARLLQMSEADIADRLKTVIPQTADHVYAVDRQNQGGFHYQEIDRAGFPKWIVGAAALLLVIVGVYAWQNKSNMENAQQNAASSHAVQNSLQVPALKASNVTVTAMTESDKQVITADAQASEVAASAASEPKVVVADGELWIKVKYRSNLIVKDKDGKMVFSQIIPAESERRFKGGAPYEVWVGIAAGAEANYGGTPIHPVEHRAPGKQSATFIAGKK